VRPHLRNDFGVNFLDAFEVGDVAFALVEVGGDGEIAAFCEPAAEVFDVLVDAEDFLDDDDGGEGNARCGLGAVGGDTQITGWDLDFAGNKAGGVGRDSGGGDREDCGGEALRE
jgi:hypothetical protein